MKYLNIRILATVLISLVGSTGGAQAGSIDFSTYGYSHNQTLTGNEFLSEGLLITSDDEIMTPCGGICISSDDSTSKGFAYDGKATFKFVLPGSTTGTSFNSISFDSVYGDLFYRVFDISGNLFDSGYGDYSFTGTTEISYFSIDYNVDGIYSVSWDDVKAAISVPEPGTLALLCLGLAVTSVIRRRKSA